MEMNHYSLGQTQNLHPLWPADGSGVHTNSGSSGLPGYVALFRLYMMVFVMCLNQIVPTLCCFFFFVVMPATVTAGKSELQLTSSVQEVFKYIYDLQL